PAVVRNHRDAPEWLKPGRTLEWINRHNLTHTCDLQGFLAVVRFHFATENRRALPRRVHHAVRASVHPINSSPSHQRFEVVAYFAFSYISPGALWFEFQIFSFGDRHFRRRACKITVTRAAVRRAVDIQVKIGFALCHWNSPLLSRSLN